MAGLCTELLLRADLHYGENLPRRGKPAPWGLSLSREDPRFGYSQSCRPILPGPSSSKQPGKKEINNAMISSVPFPWARATGESQSSISFLVSFLFLIFNPALSFIQILSRRYSRRH